MTEVIVCDHCRKIIQKDRRDICDKCYNDLCDGIAPQQEVQDDNDGQEDTREPVYEAPRVLKARPKKERQEEYEPPHILEERSPVPKKRVQPVEPQPRPLRQARPPVREVEPEEDEPPPRKKAGKKGVFPSVGRGMKSYLLGD